METASVIPAELVLGEAERAEIQFFAVKLWLVRLLKELLNYERQKDLFYKE